MSSQPVPGPGSVGVDLLDIERMERALVRTPTLAGRLFSAGERRYSASRARPGQHLAARFCAKEAVAKALRLPVLHHAEIEVISDGGPPSVRLSGSAAARAAELGVHVELSLTHDRQSAAAVAVLSAARTENSP